MHSPANAHDQLAQIIAHCRTPLADRTGLSTDFLNQYNELLMSLDMLEMAPDMLEDCLDWTARNYPEHFRASGFKDTDLIIAAYEASPAGYRAPFDVATGHLNTMVELALAALRAAALTEDPKAWQPLALGLGQAMRRQVDVLSGLVHGCDLTNAAPANPNDRVDSQACDDATDPWADLDSDSTPALSQDDIDALFD